MTKIQWLALDVGGANLKAAHSTGQALSVPFELWKNQQHLAAALHALASRFPRFDRLALTMTAELCDCFDTKSAGVHHVLDAASTLLEESKIAVWGVDAAFQSVAHTRTIPLRAAAANWLALATAVARDFPTESGLLIDVGSTTTDLVPFRQGRPAPRGHSDLQRLQSQELVYLGVRRTPVCAVASTANLGGVPTNLAAELFGTLQDVFVILGELAPDESCRDTADGRPLSHPAARARLARMVCADREELDETQITDLARHVAAQAETRLISAARAVCPAPQDVVVSGSGSFLALRVARALKPATITRLDDVWTPAASSAACAFALLSLAANSWE